MKDINAKLKIYKSSNINDDIIEYIQQNLLNDINEKFLCYTINLESLLHIFEQHTLLVSNLINLLPIVPYECIHKVKKKFFFLFLFLFLQKLQNTNNEHNNVLFICVIIICKFYFK